MKKDKSHTVKTGFKLPEDYFENFEGRLNERILEDSTLNMESNGFKVPQNYFETFETRILDRIKSERETKVVRLLSKQKLYYMAGIAASILIIISIMLTNRNRLSIDSLDTFAIERYLYQEEFSNEDLAALYQSIELSETDFIDMNISEDTYNEYIETIETEDLIIE